MQAVKSTAAFLRLTAQFRQKLSYLMLTIVSFSQSCGRKFNPRQESEITVSVVASESEKDHDAFSAIGDD